MMYACLNLIQAEGVDKKGSWQNPQDSIKKMRQNNTADEMQIFQSPLVLLIKKRRKSNNCLTEVKRVQLTHKGSEGPAFDQVFLDFTDSEKCLRSSLNKINVHLLQGKKQNQNFSSVTE